MFAQSHLEDARLFLKEAKSGAPKPEVESGTRKPEVDLEGEDQVWTEYPRVELLRRCLAFSWRLKIVKSENKLLLGGSDSVVK